TTATLTGGTGAVMFGVSNWSGTANLNGRSGNDQFTVSVGGGGIVNVADSVTSSANLLTIYGTNAGDQINVQPSKTVHAANTVNYTSSIGRLSVIGGSGADTFMVTPSTSAVYGINGGSPTPPSAGDTLAINPSFVNGASLSPSFDPATGFSGQWNFSNAA